MSGGNKIGIAFSAVAALAIIAAAIFAGISKKESKTNMDSMVNAASSTIEIVNKHIPHSLPSKYSVSNIPPRKFQLNRGTCWDFSIVGPIEALYRKKGLEKGFLNATEYVKFNEQAFGVSIVRHCQHDDPLKRGICMTPGDNVAWDSTEGGEGHLLYEFRDYFVNKMFPDAVCPYKLHQEESEHLGPWELCAPLGSDDETPSVQQLYDTNPIRMTIKEFKTVYSRSEIKALLTEEKPMAITTPIHNVVFYYPCFSEECGLCPADAHFGTPRCSSEKKPMYTYDGEFRSHHYYQYAAGHGMTVVGYNDEFVTKDGFHKGGYIIRNTWADGISRDEFGNVKPRGSHSIPYFMQEISEADERALCPNPGNPRNWFKCDMSDDKTAISTYKECVTPSTRHTAELAHQPFQLKCRDPTKGMHGKNCSATAEYYTVSLTQSTDGMYNMVLVEYEPSTDNAIFFEYSRPYDLGDYAWLFEANDTTRFENDDDYCGYYFMPYKVGEDIGALYGGFFTNLYDVEFDDSSYAVNEAKYPQYNYTYLKASMHTQKPMPRFETPFPQSRVDL